MTTQNPRRGPVAIVGYGCVLPDAPTAAQFWQNVLAGKSALKPLVDPLFKVHFNQNPQAQDSYYSLVAAQVQGYAFNWRKFRMPPAEAEQINAMQLMTLDAGAQAIEGVKVLPNERTGLVIGATGFGWQRDSGLRIRARDMFSAVESAGGFGALSSEQRTRVRAETFKLLDGALKPVSEDNVVNASASVACGRIAMHFDLKGLHYAIDAGFASALAALDVAMGLLADGTLDCVVCGGASELLSPLELTAFAKLGGLSPSELRAFDAAANGTLLGEGVAMFALKRLEDAERDGETIRAVLHAVEGSTDAQKNALVAPNPEGQSLAMRRAWAACGRDPSTARFIECHATGTQVGDASEVAALNMLVQNKPAEPILLGSAKPFVGHARAAAGAVGLLRGVMAIEQRTFPKQIGFSEPSPALELNGRPFAIPTQHTALPADVWAGVSAFGFGGINYHAVLSAPVQAQRKPASPSRSVASEPIAIVGMGGQFPGAPNVATFWQNLLAGYDGTRSIPSERWDVERYFDADPERRDTCYTRIGCFLDTLPTGGSQWRIPPSTEVTLDPSQLLVLQCAQAALLDAQLGALTIDKTRVSVQLAFLPYQGKKFLADARMHWRYFSQWLSLALENAHVPGAGAIVADAEERFKRGLPPVNEDTLTGYLGNINAARVARAFGFQGAHFVVDSACASTHGAIDTTLRALRTGQVDMALCGGVWCDMMPEFFVAACRFQALSAIGSRPFSAAADGFIPGEGAGIFVLRRLSDAERDGQRIYGVLKSVGGSSDGKGRSVLAPTVDGEAMAMRRAIEASGFDKDTIDYVECHGTGTALGDVVETEAIARSYGPQRAQPVLIGSVKSNIGHLNAAAGVPALMKTVLALQSGILPASLKSEPRNPKINSPVIAVVNAQRPWPEVNGRPRRAAVSGFGVGGSNMHMIVEQYVAKAATPEGPTGGGGIHQAKNARIVARDDDTLRKRLELLARGGDARVLRKQGIFLEQPVAGGLCLTFPGQGPQYANMARELVQKFPVAAAMLERLDAHYLTLCGRKLSDAFWTTNTAGYQQKDEDIHCAVLAVSCAIAAVLRDRGVQFDGVLGQSAGMYGALVAADVLTPEDALRAVRARTCAVLGLTLSDPGKMLSLSCGATRALALLNGHAVTLAADNGPAACIVAGETAAIEAVQQLAAAHGIEGEILPVSHAYHSRVIAGAADVFRATLASLRFQPPRVNVYSSIDGRCIPSGSQIDWPAHLLPQYWEPVRMPDAVRAAYERSVRVFVECGPKWPLTSFVEEILEQERPIAIATMHPKVGEHEHMLRAIAELLAIGKIKERSMLVERPSERTTLSDLVTQARTLRLSLETLVSKSEVSASTPEQQPFAPLPSPVAASATRQAGASSWQSICELLVQQTVTKTGYPADMLELDLDLEADLGIDTVKQLAIVSEVRKSLKLEVDPRFKLRDFRTLRALVDHLASRQTEPAASVAAPVTQLAPPSVTQPVLASVPPATTQSESTAWRDIHERLIAQTVAKTGYPADMLELDLDLEADLGIDTVKQLAIVSEVRKSLSLEVDPRFKLRDFRTLRALIDHLAQRKVPELPASARVESLTPAATLTSAECVSLSPTVVVVRAGAALQQGLREPHELELLELWRAPAAPGAVYRASMQSQANGDRLQWSSAGKALFECVVAPAREALTTASRAGHTTLHPLTTESASSLLKGWARLEHGRYVVGVASRNAADLIDAVLEATALCWAEHCGERTMALRAQSVRLGPGAWSAQTLQVEIELASGAAGKSRARAAVRTEAGLVVCMVTGIEGEWPTIAGPPSLQPDAWQALRAAARAETANGAT